MQISFTMMLPAEYFPWHDLLSPKFVPVGKLNKYYCDDIGQNTVPIIIDSHCILPVVLSPFNSLMISMLGEDSSLKSVLFAF